MKAIASAGVGIMLAATMMLAGCGADAVQMPMSPALAHDLLGTTTVSSASVRTRLPLTAWEEAPEAPAPVAMATSTWGR